jgi:hypothetical protein
VAYVAVDVRVEIDGLAYVGCGGEEEFVQDDGAFDFCEGEEGHDEADAAGEGRLVSVSIVMRVRVTRY